VRGAGGGVDEQEGIRPAQEASASVRAQVGRHRNSVTFKPRGRASDAAQYRSYQGLKPAVKAGFRSHHADPSVSPRGMWAS
jgi:hypothetical protein